LSLSSLLSSPSSLNPKWQSFSLFIDYFFPSDKQTWVQHGLFLPSLQKSSTCQLFFLFSSSFDSPSLRLFGLRKRAAEKSALFVFCSKNGCGLVFFFFPLLELPHFSSGSKSKGRLLLPPPYFFSFLPRKRMSFPLKLRVPSFSFGSLLRGSSVVLGPLLFLSRKYRPPFFSPSFFDFFWAAFQRWYLSKVFSFLEVDALPSFSSLRLLPPIPFMTVVGDQPTPLSCATKRNFPFSLCADSLGWCSRQEIQGQITPSSRINGTSCPSRC